MSRNADPSRRFLLQAVDPDYGCAVLEGIFEVDDVASLRTCLGPCADGDPDLRNSYIINAHALTVIERRFGVAERVNDFDTAGFGI